MQNYNSNQSKYWTSLLIWLVCQFKQRLVHYLQLFKKVCVYIGCFFVMRAIYLTNLWIQYWLTHELIVQLRLVFVDALALAVDSPLVDFRAQELGGSETEFIQSKSAVLKWLLPCTDRLFRFLTKKTIFKNVSGKW